MLGPAVVADHLGPSEEVSAQLTALLGIDAAWTYKNPSGVSLLTLDERGEWRCVALAPSYDSFLDLAAGTPVDWESRPTGGSVEVGELLSAAQALGADSVVEVVAIDMPLSLLPITGRRDGGQGRLACLRCPGRFCPLSFGREAGVPI